MSDLLFGVASPASPNLVFGDELDVAPPLVEFTVTGTFPALTVSASAVPTTQFAVTGSFPPLTVTCSLEYESNTARPTVGQTANDWQSANANPTGATTGQQDSAPQPTGWNTPWRLGADNRTEIDHPLPDRFFNAYEGWATGFEQAEQTRINREFDHRNGDRTLRLAINDAYEAAARLRYSRDFPHEDGDRTKRGNVISPWQIALRFKQLGQDNQMSSGVPFAKDWWARFQEAMRPVPGLSFPPVTPPPLPGFTCYNPNGELLFEHPLADNGFLVFSCDDGTLPPPPPGPEGPIIVPVRAVYIVLNSATLRRVSDNALIKTLGMSLSLDTSSWTWGFDATIQGSDQGLVESNSGSPVELLATINGTSFRLLAEKLTRDRVFGKTTIKVSGRGRNALLDAPYAPSMTFQNTIDRTAQQLAGDALLYNGVPVGWAVDWGLTDWLVPAGVWTHQGTHVSALNTIAQSAGGYLQPHKTLQTVRILPRYPVKPWAWNTVTPDFVLPADVTVREGIEWINKPEYNRVFVSGQADGVLGQITRQGTAGDIEAQMVTDPLITHVDAARQRGIAILGDAGRMAMVNLSLPILAETGVIEVGKFVRYEDGATTRLGLVRSMGISVGASALDTRQQITVETHL